NEPPSMRSAMTDTILRPDFASNVLEAGFTTRSFAPEGTSLDETRTHLVLEVGMPLASVGQVHRADVATVREPGHVDAHDGLVTDQRGLLLTVIAADCGVVLLSDLEAGVVGACHSGWRGTVAGIVGETIRAMEALGSSSSRTRAYVAPCISLEAFEVGEEVAEQFDDAVVERRAEWPRPHVDLKAVLEGQLRQVGVSDIEVAAGCPVLETDRFYSYRAEGGTAGRMVGFIGMR
ncbi:polyphenol oxidase family protein, partial [Rubrivirga sp.]|uniref:polyphenol oxidase family protein n=1 Tax=Rubrivirga sp. TaxID=1885344 RepID=UPI003C78E483